MAGRSRDSVVESGHGTEATATMTAMRAADTASDVLGDYLRARAAEFLRGLRVHAESAGSAEGAARAAEAVDSLRAAARRLNGALHTYRPLLDPSWADQLRGELSWLSGTLAREYAYAGQLERLLGALHRLATGAPTGTVAFVSTSANVFTRVLLRRVSRNWPMGTSAVRPSISTCSFSPCLGRCPSCLASSAAA
ncbi:CHAD domain-containing protein [Streptomyces axinellae]|uniref:CHAD domain-containing protein n=1 Tax=Streptomyces axinellae TaxID=552788 RepID=UPI0031CE9E15